MATYNKNRIISLDKENIDSATKNSDWRHNLSFVLGLSGLNDTDDTTNIISQSSLKSYDVAPEINLLMLDKLPDIQLKSNLQENKKINNLLSNENFNNYANTITEAGSAILSSIDYQVNGSNGIANLQSFAPWVKNLKVWSSSDAPKISFSYTFKFNLGQYGLWNAKQEVFLPIINLSIPTFIQYIGSTTMRGPFPTEISLIFNLINNLIDNGRGNDSTIKDTYSDTVKDWSTFGDNFKSIFSGGIKDALSNIGDTLSSLGTAMASSVESTVNLLERLILNSYKGYLYTIKFGNFMSFRHMMITDSKFAFGNEVDQNGYPISGSITLTFEGLMPPALTSKSDNGAVDRLSVRFGG